MFKTCVRHALAGMAMLVLAGAARADGPYGPGPGRMIFEPPPIFTWSGFYIGGNIGGAWANSSLSDQATTLTNRTTGADLSSEITHTGFTVADPMLINGDGIFIYQDAE